MTRRFVLSGCSGGGKSTLLGEMGRRGFQTVAEPGRRIVQAEMERGGSAVPWTDPALFAHRVLNLARTDYDTTTGGDVIFDRSLLDAVVWYHRTGTALPPAFEDVVDTHRYHGTVFLAPPWPEIFENDADRRHGLDQAMLEYQALLDRLPRMGYQIEIIPKIGVQARADWLEGKTTNA